MIKISSYRNSSRFSQVIGIILNRINISDQKTGQVFITDIAGYYLIAFYNKSIGIRQKRKAYKTSVYKLQVTGNHKCKIG